MTREEREKLSRTVLEGLSVGDAFGEMYAYGHDEVRRRVELGVPHGPWWWTDDTAMALGIHECLVRAGGIDEAMLGWIFARNFKREPDRGYGRMARNVLQQIGAGVPWEDASRSAFGGGSLGNGAAMRVGPVGAWFAEDPARVVVEATKSAKVTHWHPEGVAGAVAVAIAVSAAWRTRDLPTGEARVLIEREILGHTPPGEVRDGMEAALALDPGLAPADAGRLLGNGSQITAPDTVPYVIWSALRRLDDFADALIDTVEAGGDCDTNAAMVGALLVARLGEGAIPAEWRSAREALDFGKM
ncbi:ADP-ribosylglycohydrolase family protein [Luteolibacter marinus]|uniref:ADP-ribosylglycohydrolase family protein n=1 Tax=Luteolibacter marinus TaxID=2776705 RepID=UPI00186802D4|nr:ADP-ribosylglycohydrolase family protein [Luteolibacter marinus]